MSISYYETIQLGIAYEGRTLTAKLYDESGDQYGDDITTGFTEVDNGDYLFATSLDDTFSGYVRYYVDAEYVAISDYIDASALASEASTSVLSVSEAKNRLRIDTDSEDSIIEAYIYAAEATIAQWVDVTSLVTLYNNSLTAKQQYLAKLVVQMLVGDLYENREANSPLRLYNNPHFDALVNVLRYRDSGSEE
jgi:uncharacterized phage protein (predicted DNA packaging)